MAGECVLVIDDSKQAREFAAEYVLKPCGFEVVLARDGAEGIRLALQSPPDLIILDYEMPKMNGLEVMRALRAKHLTIPVILSTAHGSEQFAVEVFRLGVRDYVTKPYKVEEMLAAIESALTEARLKRERDELVKHVLQANRALESRVRELNALYGIGKSVTALLDHEGLLNRIVEAAHFVTGAQSCALHLLDLDTGRLRTEATRGASDNGSRAPIEMMSRVVVRNRQPAASPTGIVVPLLVGSRLIGTLDVVNRAGGTRPFTDHDKHLLQALADYAAIAIENARLFRELEASKEREKNRIRGLFERYVAPQVVNRLLADPRMGMLGGARQPITALFADVRGYSAFAEHTPPEALVKILNYHFDLAAKAILEQEGTLDKFMGDAVMAFFNAPVLQTDHAVRAVRAALAMQRILAEEGTRLPRAVRLTFGIGIATGDAVVGNIGTSRLMNYTIIGDCVNLARRLQENAKGGQILVDGWTVQRMQDKVHVRALGDMHVKGRSSPLPVFELVALK
ncbi:MAG TPA: adenylate/guanylate cyclase domain-containing protein [Anaerolineae bacterium]|nr:adenylate/guanylate cyclase domain-containing protein [Anaerolineae bacterium]